MGLDIFFAEDIRNAILAADEASAATAEVAARGDGDASVLQAYRQGYRAALATMALAFGLGSGDLYGQNAAGKRQQVPKLCEPSPPE